MPVVVGVKVWVPLAASVPLQEPDAVQLVASGDDQVIVVVLPSAIAVADKLSVGVVGTGSVIVKVWEVAGELPTTFVHTSEYVLVPCVDAVIVCEPFAPSEPLQLPDAVQLVAYCEDQLMVVEPPAGIEDSPKLKVGAGGTTPTLKLTELLADNAPDASVQASV